MTDLNMTDLQMSRLIKSIQDALGTAETGEVLIEVASNAHKAEQREARFLNLAQNAKAAIEAMRHPSIEMIEAGVNANPNSYGPGLHPAVFQYRTMIDTALKE